MDAIFGAAYVFLGRAWVHLDRGRKGNVVVTLKLKSVATRDELARLSDEFENELVDQVVRLQLAKRRTRFHDDPLGIAVPSEERLIGAKKSASSGGEAR